MLTIYKYPLKKEVNEYGSLALQMPYNAKPISVINQQGELVMYAEVDTTDLMATRELYICGSGRELPMDIHNYDFVGTVMQAQFVWHVYAKKPNAL
jgi:hypothetical protein